MKRNCDVAKTASLRIIFIHARHCARVFRAWDTRACVKLPVSGTVHVQMYMCLCMCIYTCTRAP